MSDAERTSLMENLAFHSPLSLRDCCEGLRRTLDLPEFFFDCENETEWGLVEVDGLEYNVSRPYKKGTLQSWNNSTPPDCNFGMILIFYRDHDHAGDHEWAEEHVVLPVSQAIADALDTPVHYHQTWFGVGNTVNRNQTVNPR